MAKAYKYIGSGEFYSGIPMRDLTEEEFAALDADQQTAVTTGGLYQPTAKPKPQQEAPPKP